MSAAAAPRLLWSWAGLPNVLLVVLPLAALGVQTRYRIPSQYASWVLPWVGIALSALSLLLLLNRLMAHPAVGSLRTRAERFERWSFAASLVSFVLAFLAPGWLGSPGFFSILLWGAIGTASAALLVYAGRVTATTLSGSLTSSFRWLERATLLLVLAFVGHGAVTLVNGALDFSAPIEAKAQVVAIDGVEVDLGRSVSVSWVDLRSWRTGGLERIFLHEPERRRMWPGQAVLVSVHPGALGIPWVSRVTRDDEVYFREILVVAPPPPERSSPSSRSISGRRRSCPRAPEGILPRSASAGCSTGHPRRMSATRRPRRRCTSSCLGNRTTRAVCASCCSTRSGLPIWKLCSGRSHNTWKVGSGVMP